MKPVIGLIPLYDDEKKSYWMLPGYMKVLEQCGALPIMLPLTTDAKELEELFTHLDGLLLTGGHDVDPKVYGEKRTKECGIACGPRDEMEQVLLRKALETDLPVLGICRGIQFINAALGGDLYQDLPTEYGSRVDHHMTPPYDRSAHKVEVLPDSLLASIIGSGEKEVNSYHHQAVRTVSPKVQVEARSEDGLVEAISVIGQRFAVGVQWHPEFSYESNAESVALVQAFVDACRGV